MTSNQKKSYQYYFKKLQTPTSTKDLRRPQHSRTQSYVKYEKYEKLKSSSIVPSSTKNIKNERVSLGSELQKRGGLYSSEYTPGKYGLNRQFYMSGDTDKKYTPKYITPSNVGLSLTPIQQVSQQSRVKEFSPNQQSPTNQIQQNKQKQHQQQVTSKYQENRKSISLQKQHNKQVKYNHKGMDESIFHFQSVDLRQKNTQLTNFINSTLGKSIISLNDEHLVQSKYENEKYQQLKNSQNKNGQKSDYFSQIEKFKEKLKKQQMKMSTMFTVDQKTLQNHQRNPHRMMTVSHVESRTFLNESTIMSQKNLVECKNCEQLRNKLTQSQKQVQDLYSKRHHTMQQVYKQHRTIKQYHENESKLKLQIDTKSKQINNKNARIQKLQKELRISKQQEQKIRRQIKQKREVQIPKIRSQHQQEIHRQRQKTADYLSCITQLNKKIQQLDQKIQLTVKQLTMKNESEVNRLKQMHQKEMLTIRQSMTIQNQKLKQYYEKQMNLLTNKHEKEMDLITNKYESEMNLIINKHKSQIKSIEQKHKQQTKKLTLQIQELNNYKNQLQYLTQTVVKLQSQILLQKTISTNLSQQNKKLNIRINQLIDQEKINQQKFFQLKRSIEYLEKEKQQNKLLYETIKKDMQENKLLYENMKIDMQENKLIYETTLKQMSQKLNLKQLKIQQLLNNHNNNVTSSSFLTIKNNKSDQLPQQQWSSISPSTSSIGHNLKKTVVQKQQLSTDKEKQKEKQRQKQNEINSLQQQDIKNKEYINQQELNQLSYKYRTLQANYNILIQQVIIKESQLSANMNRIQQIDQKLAKCSIQIQSLQQVNNKLQKTIVEKDSFINENQQIIIELNDKIIALQRKLYPSDQHIEYPSEDQHIEYLIEDKDDNVIDNSNNINHQDNMAELHQELQNKQQQIIQLQQQLHQSLEIINLLKNQLTLKQNHNHQTFIQKQQHQLTPPTNKLSIQIHQLQHHSHNQSYQSHHQQSNKKKQKKQQLLKQYFIKTQQFYNQILQIFGLQIIHHSTLQFNNILSPLCTPRKRNPSIPKFLIQQDQIPQQPKQSNTFKQTQPKYTQNPTSSSNLQKTQTNKQQNQLPQTKALLSLPESASTSQLPLLNPLQQTFHYLSQNQEQVLRIINQWIRKLQRQSSTIHQYKQKCQFLQQQVTHLSQDNNMLSLEKLQIYDKYQAFIVKLQAENNQLQDKTHMMGDKILQLQGYIKELEETIQQTNKQCMKKGLISLELHKQHSSFGKLIYKSLLMFSQQQDNVQNKQRQNYIEEFYQKYDLNLSESKSKQSQNKQQQLSQNKQKQQSQNIQKYLLEKIDKTKNLTKSQAKPQDSLNHTTQNEQDQITETKIDTQPLKSNQKLQQNNELIITS